MRYALAINAPENRDTDFTWDDFRSRNNELADVFGNFINRTMKFAQKTFGGVVPEPADPGEAEKELMQSVAAARDEMEELLRNFKLKAACLRVMDLAREGNRYFDQSQPWKTARTDIDKCAATIYYSIQFADSLRILFTPFIPQTCVKTGKMLGSSSLLWKDAGEENIPAGRILGEPEILLEKLKEGFEKVMNNDESAAEPEVKETISYDEFMKMDMRVGIVKEVHDIKGADKLFRLMVDMGDHSRQLVAGMKPFYSKDELTDRKVVVLTNLQPVKIMGVKSNGMILASDDGKGGVYLLQPAIDACPGDSIR
jgi:methionyl-tRNA synthetase